MHDLHKLLSLLDKHIDPEHCAAVDARYRLALGYQNIDRPPLVIQTAFGKTLELPSPWNEFSRYTYRETFNDPAAMLQNILLDRVVPGVLLKDDNPLAIRNNHGTIQIASVLGGEWQMHADNYPWVDHFDTIGEIEKIALPAPTEVSNKGLLPKALATLKFYHDTLDRYPNCRKAIQISLPDLQGPLDTAEQLWGSDIYYAFNEQPELLSRLLARIVDVMGLVEKEFRRLTRDRLDPEFNTQHGYVIPGRLLIRNDSSIMISPTMYAEFIRPHDARLLKETGGGAIHFCGNGQHLVKKMMEIETLQGLDFGQPEQMDLPLIYSLCQERKIALTNLHPSRDELVSGKAKKLYPTGVGFVYYTDNLEDARDVVSNYYN